MDPGNAYAIIATMAYSKIKFIIEQTVASDLIYLNPHANDQEPGHRSLSRSLSAWLQRLQGGRAREAPEAFVGCLATEFRWTARALRDQLRRSTEEIRRYCLFGAQMSGNADRCNGFAEECMAEYELDGWKVPDLTDPGKFSYHVMRGAIT
jgi:hypothetical protein